MNKFLKTVLPATIFVLGLQGAHAGYLANDLVLGFDRDNGGQSPADYVINLGNYQSSVGVGGGSVVNLSGYFSAITFNSLYGSLSSGVSMSVVGGNGASAGRDLFASVLRSGQGTASLAGSSGPDGIPSAYMANGANTVGAMMGPSGLNLSAGQSTTVPRADANSFNSWILSTTPPSYYSGTGIDPRAMTADAVLYEDLYRARDGVNGNGFDYLGYFTLDPNGAQTLTFTPATVPEPSAAALASLSGLLVLLLRMRSENRSKRA